MASQAIFAPGYTVVIYYPYNGSSPRKKLPTGVNVAAERRYYDLGALLWFMEAWYWDVRDGYFYFERGPDIHPKAPAIYLIIPPTAGQGTATDGGSPSSNGDEHAGRRSLTVLPLILAPVLYLINPLLIYINAQLPNYVVREDVYNAVDTVGVPVVLMSIAETGHGYS